MRKSVIALLVVLLLYVLVQLAGVIFVDLQARYSPIGTNSGNTAQQPVDIASLQSGRLFGTRVSNSGENAQATDSQTALAALQADATTLSLRLEGVVVGNPPSTGFAMITSNNQPGTYRIGDRLPVGNRVVLQNIYADRVLIENNGSIESLWLYAAREGVAPARTGSSSQVSEVETSLSPGSSYNPVAMVNEIRERFSSNAMAADFLTLSEIVKITPEHYNTQLVGYRLSPGEHVKEFVRLGLKTNDVVTRVNGIELNDISRLPDLFEIMSSARNITLTLQREGQALELDLALDALPKNN